MRRYQLAEVYHRLRLAVRKGRVAEASELLSLAIGVPLPERPRPPRLPVTIGQLLSYRGAKPAELAMVAADVKPVVKLEDLPLAQAHAFTQRHNRHYRILWSEPYRKDYLLLRSQPALDDSQALVSLYVSRGEQAEALRDLERDHREDFRGCGQLLGFPDCCIEAFAADFGRSRQDQDTLNDDACRRLLASTAAPDLCMNPLSDWELLSYYPCRLDCPRALAQAERNATALERARPGAIATARQALRGPTLFWRLPFFAVLSGTWTDDGGTLSGLQMNAFPDPEVRRIQGLLAAHLAGLLAPDARLRRSGAATWADGDAGESVNLGDSLLIHWKDEALAKF